MINKWLKLVCLSVAISGLVACSHKPAMHGNTTPYNNARAANAGATAYGLSQQASYKGSQRNQYGEVINSLTAPSNQTYYFAFDSNVVQQRDQRAIAIQANYLVSHPRAKVRLEGNTDNRGSREYNIGLGWRRDQALARILEQQGVKPRQIDMVSYGKERPVAFGNNAHDWRLNRRVNLIYERVR